MLLRFDPFRELDRLSDQVGQLAGQAVPAIPMDAVKVGDTVEVRFELPGFDPESIDLEVDRNELTLTAERKAPSRDDEQVIVRERRFGRFTRQLMLGDTLDGSNVRADYREGVLTVTIPVAESAKPRKVAISGGSDRSEAIDVDTAEDRQLASAER